MKTQILIASLLISLTAFTKEVAHKPESESKSKHSTADSHSTGHEEKAPAVSPEQALKYLKNGNARYLKGVTLRKDGQSKKDIERLNQGQTPHTIVLSCSDSRVPPELVFDQKLGEIFVVRTAGETLDSMALGSIEYAVEHLGAGLILVMGHTQCGAVKAALSTMDGKDAGSPSLNKLVADIHPRIQSFSKRAPSSDVSAESWANADGIVKDLLSRSEIISKRVKNKTLEIKSSLYHLNDGHVEFR